MTLNKRFLRFAAGPTVPAVIGVCALMLFAGSHAAAQTTLKDVQLGERGNQSRLAFFCDGACSIEKTANGGFLLHGVAASFDLDLSKRSERLRELHASPAGDGALLRIDAAQRVEYANLTNCSIRGENAVCLDLFFGGPASRQTAIAPTQTAAAPPRQSPAAVLSPPRQKIAAAAPPALRDDAQERAAEHRDEAKPAAVDAPERLAPPAGAILAKVQPIEPAVATGKPAMRSQEMLAPAVQSGFAERVRFILGKDLTSAYCNNAEATLQADAWALGAMVDVGLCAAARGDLAEGERILSRLLQYTPDNYEAHVGRALIAEDVGEKGVARKYFQEALNAPPPIEESTRIVKAMTALQ